VCIVIETRQRGQKTTEELPLEDGELVTAIAKLDGDQTSALSIRASDGLMLVGGGDTGRYVVTAWVAGDGPFELLGDPGATGEISMVVGGQLARQPMRYIVSHDRVLKVARCFLTMRALDADEAWDQP
jgi:hypothetical protein